MFLIVASFIYISINATSVFALTTTTYNFNTDTVGQAPSNVTVQLGTFEVANNATLGNSLHALTGGGSYGLSALTFSHVPTTSTDMTIIWKEAYVSGGDNHGFTLRSSGAYNGYHFQVSNSDPIVKNKMSIYKITNNDTFTLVADNVLTSSSPRWFKATAAGNVLTFYYSDDGVTYTANGTYTDASNTYASGGLQFAGGWQQSTMTHTYIDDISATYTDSGAITITSPKSYQVIQRGVGGTANITISGTYTGTPSAIEASWNGGSYTTITANPTGGTYSGILSNQAAGQGTLTVRFVDDTSTTVSKTYVGIGDIFVIAGQSNASGWGTNNQSYSHATLKASLFGNDDNWKELVDPTDSNSGQVDAVSSDGASSSVWPLVTTLFLADQNVPVAFIPTAKGGSAISQWQPNSSNHGDATTLYGSMYRRITAVGGAKAILFWQGETDAINGTSQATYKSQLVTMADSIYSDFGIKTVVAMMGKDGPATEANIDKVRLAQQSAWNDGGNVLAGPPLYDVNIADQYHFATNSELQLSANRWWASVQKDLYNGADGRGPILSAAEYNSAKTQITLTFTDSTLPLLPFSGLTGFTAKDNGTPVSITSTSRIASNKLRITLSSAANGTIIVSLGAGNTGTGATVPTDSSTYNLPAEIFVDHATTQLDETAPVTIDNTESSWHNSSVTITLTCSDTGGTGCAYTYYTTDGSDPTTSSPSGNSFTLSSDGVYTIKYFSLDVAGNPESIKTAAHSVDVDTTAPSIHTPSTSSTTNNTTPTWTWTASTDSGSGLAATPYTIQWSQDAGFVTGVSSSNSTTNSFTQPVALADGTWYFRVKSTDTAGNVSSYSSNGSVLIDTSVSPASNPTPTASGDTSTPFTGATTSSSASFTTIPTDLTNIEVRQTITFDASSSGSNIAKYEWNFGDGTTSNEMKVDHKYDTPGRYTVTLTTTDNSGNKSTVSKTIDIRPPAPTISNIKADGTSIVFEGKSFPKTTINLTIHSNPYTGQTVADKDGKFSYTVENGSETLGEGDHTILASAAVILSDNTQLKSKDSKTYDFKVSVDNGKLKVEMGKTKTWKYISFGLGLLFLLVIGFVLIRMRKRRRI